MIDAGLLLALKAACVLGGALVAARAARHWPARARHSILAGAMLVVVLLPALGQLARSWEVSTLRLPAPGTLAATMVEATRTGDAAPPVAPVVPVAPVAPVAIGEVGADEGTVLPGALTLLGSVWLLGFLVVLLRMTRSLLRVRSLVRRAAAAPPSIRRTTASLARDLGLRRGVRVLLSQETTTPFTWGLLRPVCVLPTAARSWDASALRMALAHELAHVRAHDWSARIVARLACALHWFDPLAWWAERRLTLESERACDAEVLRAERSAPAYAELLLHVARHEGRERAFDSLVPAGAASDLELRIRSILAPKCTRRAPRWLWALPLFIGSLVAGVELGAASSTARHLTVELHNGSITVIASENDLQLPVDARLDVDVTADAVTIRDPRLDSGEQGGPLNVVVRVPADFSAERIHLQTGRGRITLNTGAAHLDALTLITGNGHVRSHCSAVAGELRVRSGIGDVEVRLREASPSGGLVFTGRGSVRFSVPGSSAAELAPYELFTGLGALTVDTK